MSSIGIAAETAADRTSQGTQRVDAIVRLGIVAFALYFWAIAALMALAPSFFFAHVGPFGMRNDHYIRDTATFNAAFGASLTVAYWRPSWRVPVLCCVAVQFALHTFNHLVDIDAAHPHWLGPADFVSLALSTVLLGFLVLAARVKR
jgi:hypothetical protein